MALMLIMGFVFLGILNHSLSTSSYMQNRSQADDLSEAGIRYAHAQLLNSDLGADWRGLPTPMIDMNPNLGGGPDDPGNDTTVDPDAYYLRPPANIAGGAYSVPWPGSTAVDEGGPDGLGPFFRVNFRSGRALIRVRWAPTDAIVFNSSPTGALRSPGAARNYIIIESVGREGVITPNDPTVLVNNTRVRIRNYASAADFADNLNTLRGAEAKFGSVQVIRAFASIGIIETSRFITNKYHQSIPADIGVLANMGANYRGIDVASTDLPTQMGTTLPLLTFAGASASAPTLPLPVGGSLFSNADLTIHGQIIADLNFTLGDQWDVAGNISSDGTLAVNESKWNPTSQTWATIPIPGSNVNSKSPSFNTGGGIIRDGSNTPDVNGAPRAVGRKDPPSADSVDQVTGVNRYLEMTRDSGPLVGTGSSGRFGFGQGVYVNNFSDVQGGVDPTSRTNAGGAGSLVNDWLNPSTASGSYWDGFFYVPPGAYVTLLSDGFLITRNPKAPSAEQYWLNPDGTTPPAPLSSIRYRLGRGSDGNLHILSGVSIPATINGTLGLTDFDNGQLFNGVLYFEGNARVRGVIPTDIQLTLYSNATIYVEGSITKGITGNQWTATYRATDPVPPVQIGSTLGRPSKSMLMLMAKDYVCVNTTQFWGPANGQYIQPKIDAANPPGFNAVDMPVGSTGMTLQADFPFDPVGQPGDGTVPSNPSTFKPYVASYEQAGTTNKIVTSILLAQTMDDGAGSRSFVEIDLNAGTPLPTGSSSPYEFPIATPTYSNVADMFETGNYIRDYGLGGQNFQRYGNFEQISLPLIDPTQLTVANNYVTSTAATGNYTAFDQVTNQIRFQPGSFNAQPTNDYLLGRFAVVPADIRIEASMFAEEGSFFIIPGPWFNPNPNDTYANYLTQQGTAPAGTPGPALDLARQQAYGASPNMPFFGEPLDARIVISGAVSENMPPPAAVQAEWQRKWGWIPEYLGSTSQMLAEQHVPALWTVGAATPWAPNIIIQYDPVLATGRRFGFVDPSSSGNLSDPGTYVRTAWIDYNMDGIQQPNELVPLPPIPRLPVSPTLAYFGEVH